MVSILKEIFYFIRSFWHGFKNAEVEAFVALLVATLIFGVGFYSSVEGWSYLDALYFSVMTITTVGYGDLAPVTDIGKLFTIGYVFVGIVLILGFVNLIVKQTIEERTLEQTIEGEKFLKSLKNVKK